MGKTVWMLNSAIETAKTGSKVLFISIEMNLYQCFQRILSKVSNVSAQKIQQPKQMTPKEWKMIEEAGNEISDIYEEKFWIEEVTELTPPQLERKIKHYKKVHDIDIVYVDYAQIMLTKEGNEPKDQADFAQISGALRRVAKAQNVAVVVGSQLSRDVEKRPDKRPVMADIRNSGAFEQDAAQVVGLYRDAVYNPETEKPNVLEFIVLKNRFGKGSVTIEFNYDLDKQAIFSNGS
jgi:replicative DNA helicase